MFPYICICVTVDELRQYVFVKGKSDASFIIADPIYILLKRLPTYCSSFIIADPIYILLKLYYCLPDLHIAQKIAYPIYILLKLYYCLPDLHIARKRKSIAAAPRRQWMCEAWCVGRNDLNIFVQK